MKFKWIWTGLIGLGFAMALFLLGCSQDTTSKKPTTKKMDIEKKKIVEKEKAQKNENEMVADRRQITKLGPDSIVAKKRHKKSESKRTGKQKDRETEGIQVGSKSINFKSGTYNEKDISLDQYTGRVVLLDFWATWCKPCIREMATVKKIQDDFGANKQFALIGVSLDKDAGAVAKFVKKYDLDYPHVFDGKMWKNEVAGLYGVRRIPYTVVIGKDGKVIATELRGKELYDFIAKQLAG